MPRYPCVAPCNVDQRVDIAGNYCEIHIFCDLYYRIKKVHHQWQQLKEGTVVMCRTIMYDPSSSLFADHPGPMTCARTVSTSDPEFTTGWEKAIGTNQYRCGKCERLYNNCLPLSGLDYVNPTRVDIADVWHRCLNC